MLLKYDKEIINGYAKKEGFIRDTLEKVMRLTEILSFISDNEMLSKKLALKGGTAINLLYLNNMPRLSVDIDLDYTNPSREIMLQERPQIRGQIEKYMYAAGYILSKKTKSPDALDSFVYRFDNTGMVKDNLKIEINYAQRCHVLPAQKRHIETLGFLKEVPVICVAPEEVYASKTVALLSRTAPRDLFDLYNVSLQHEGNFDKDTYRKCVVFYSAVNGNTSSKIDLSSIDKLTPYKIKTDLLPYLRKGQHVDLEKIKNHVQGFLKDSLSLENDEKEFLLKFSEGQFKPELLFGKNEISARMREHPMANWKINHIQEKMNQLKIEDADINDARYTGEVHNITDNYFAQLHGDAKIIRHYYVNVEDVNIKIGDSVLVRYKNGKGQVTLLSKEREIENEL